MNLLDSNVIIDYCNATLPINAKTFVESSQPKMSVITRIELFGSPNIPEQELAKLNQFVAITEVYDNINIDIINHTIRIRQQYRTKLPDAIIAATALTYDLTLITRNIADFSRINGLQIINPHDL